MAAAHHSHHHAQQAPADATLVIFAATGNQGGSIARHIAQTGRFANVRLVTRKVDGESAQKLLAEVNKISGGRTKFSLVAASFDDRASLDAALAGAEYSFAVTNWWELFFAGQPGPGEAAFPAAIKATEQEIVQGKNWVDAAKQAGIKFSVYSGLEDTRKSGFKNVYHYHGKGEVEEYLWANIPSASIRLPFYINNLGTFMKPQPDGTLAVPFGDDTLPVMAVEDTGAVVDGIFKQVLEYGPQYWDKQALGLAGDKVKVADLVALWSKAAGKEIKYAAVPAEAFAKFGFPGDVEMAEMFSFQRDHERSGRRDVALTRAIATGRISTAAEWFTANADRLKQ